MAPPERRRSARELYRQLDGPDDDSFRRSLAGRMRGLGERAVHRAGADPLAAAQQRRAALADYDRVRRRRFRWILAGGVAALVAAEVAYFEFVAIPGKTPPPTQVAEAVAMPASPAPPRPPPVIVKANVPAGPSPAESPLTQRPLSRDDVREVQRRLHGFGFNAGPVDGVVGRTTQGAVMHYRQSRGLPQSGTVDRALLERLRDDGAPQSAPPRAARRSAPPSPPPRSTDPFEPVRVEFERFERWVQSLGR